MGIARILLPWDSQPQDVADPSDWLGDGAVLWSAAHPNIFVGARSLVSSVNNSHLPSVGVLGKASGWSRVTNAGVDFGTVQPLSFTDTSGITIAVVAAPVASANRKTAISFRNGSGSVEQVDLLFNANSAVGTVSGFFTLYTRNTAASGSAVSVTSAGFDGENHCWIAGNSSTSGYVYKDGISQTLTTSTRMSGTYVSTLQKLRVGNIADYTADGAYVLDDPIYLVIAWPYLLTPGRAAEISRTLVQNLGPAFAPRSIWIPVSAGGGPPPTFNSAWARNSNTVLVGGRL